MTDNSYVLRSDFGVCAEGLGFELKAAGVLLLEPHISPFYSGYFRDGGLVNYLLGLDSNHNPPDLSLPSS
jgi:hypothetical protein